MDVASQNVDFGHEWYDLALATGPIFIVSKNGTLSFHVTLFGSGISHFQLMTYGSVVNYHALKGVACRYGLPQE